MEKITYDLCVKDTLFNPFNPASSLEKTATYKRYKSIPNSKLLYKVWIFLDGDDLPFVESVRYHLHPTFPNPVQLVERTMKNYRCVLPTFIWGMFNVKAEIFLIDGKMLTINHFLTFGDQIASHDDIQWSAFETYSLQPT